MAGQAGGTGAAARARPVRIKMATLAPEGSPWHQVLEDIAQDWQELSGGQVRLSIYAGGVVGDEGDVVRKMRIGQVQAAALTVEGLSYIDRGIYGLSLPLLARNYRELDWIRRQVEPELRHRFESKGFEVLAWADIGWIYWFTREPIRTPEELRRLRIFTWAGDPHSPRLWKAAGFHAVSLSAVDVLPGLQTGLIDAVDSSPLSVAAFQWFGVAKHMTDLPWAALTGALIIREESWNRIPAILRPQLLEAAESRSLRIQNEIRYTDGDAVKAMQAHGLKVVTLTADERGQWQSLLNQYLGSLRGTLVDSAMFDRVLELKSELQSPGFVLP